MISYFYELNYGCDIQNVFIVIFRCTFLQNKCLIFKFKWNLKIDPSCIFQPLAEMRSSDTSDLWEVCWSDDAMMFQRKFCLYERNGVKRNKFALEICLNSNSLGLPARVISLLYSAKRELKVCWKRICANIIIMVRKRPMPFC